MINKNIQADPNNFNFYRAVEGSKIKGIVDEVDTSKGEIVQVIPTENGVYYKLKVPTQKITSTMSSKKKGDGIGALDPLGLTEGDAILNTSVTKSGQQFKYIFAKPINSQKYDALVATDFTKIAGNEIFRNNQPNQQLNNFSEAYVSSLIFKNGSTKNLFEAIAQGASDLNTKKQEKVTINIKEKNIYMPNVKSLSLKRGGTHNNLYTVTTKYSDNTENFKTYDNVSEIYNLLPYADFNYYNTLQNITK